MESEIVLPTFCPFFLSLILAQVAACAQGTLFFYNHVPAAGLDAPVLDIKSWPGGKGAGKGDKHCWVEALKIYGLTEETVGAFKGNPLDQLEPIAKAHIPILAVVGDADTVVPYPENTAVMEGNYKMLGGKIEVIMKHNGDHHPHSLKDPKPIVDFLLANAYKN